MLKGKMKGSYCQRFLAAGHTGLLGGVIFIFTQQVLPKHLCVPGTALALEMMPCTEQLQRV